MSREQELRHVLELLCLKNDAGVIALRGGRTKEGDPKRPYMMPATPEGQKPLPYYDRPQCLKGQEAVDFALKSVEAGEAWGLVPGPNSRIIIIDVDSQTKLTQFKNMFDKNTLRVSTPRDRDAWHFYMRLEGEGAFKGRLHAYSLFSGDPRKSDVSVICYGGIPEYVVGPGNRGWTNKEGIETNYRISRGIFQDFTILPETALQKLLEKPVEGSSKRQSKKKKFYVYPPKGSVGRGSRHNFLVEAFTHEFWEEGKDHEYTEAQILVRLRELDEEYCSPSLEMTGDSEEIEQLARDFWKKSPVRRVAGKGPIFSRIHTRDIKNIDARTLADLYLGLNPEVGLLSMGKRENIALFRWDERKHMWMLLDVYTLRAELSKLFMEYRNFVGITHGVSGSLLTTAVEFICEDRNYHEKLRQGLEAWPVHENKLYIPFNEHESVIPFPEGPILDLQGARELRDQERIELYTSHDRVPWTPVDVYDENSQEAIRWNAHLDSLAKDEYGIVDEELKKYIEKLYAIMMIHRGAKRLWIFKGPGDTAKTTIRTVARRLFGTTLIGTLPPDWSKEGGHPVWLHSLRERSTVFGEEIGKWGQINVLKDLTGGRDVEHTSRGMHENFKAFVSRFKLVWATNKLPQTPGVDGALRKRTVIIPMRFPVPEAEQREDYAERLVDSCGPMILRRLIDIIYTNDLHINFDSVTKDESIPEAVKNYTNQTWCEFTGIYNLIGDTFQSAPETFMSKDEIQATYGGHFEKENVDSNMKSTLRELKYAILDQIPGAKLAIQGGVEGIANIQPRN